MGGEALYQNGIFENEKWKDPEFPSVYVVLEMPEKHSSAKQNFRGAAGYVVCLPHTCYVYLQVAVVPPSFLSMCQKRRCGGTGAGGQGKKAFPETLSYMSQ